MRGLNTSLQINHPNVIKPIGFRYPLTDQEVEEAKVKSIQIVYNNRTVEIDFTTFIFVFDYIDKQRKVDSLMRDYLNELNHDRMNPTIRNKIIFGIASIMKSIHNQGIIHRDLSLSNFYLDDKDEVKIGGFYLAKFFDKDNLNNTTAIGTPIYMAPELFIDTDETYDLSADVYAFGIVLYKMFSNTLSFDNSVPRSPQQFMLRISKNQRPGRPDIVSGCYWDLINKCWNQNMFERPTFDEIVEELINDKFALNEFGMNTNLDEIHDYQNRIDSY